VQERAQVHAFDVLGDQERAAVEAVEVEDLHDVAVVQTGGDARFIDEHERGALVHEQLGPDGLDDDRTLEPVRARDPAEIDLAHAAPSELAVDAIAPEIGQHPSWPMMPRPSSRPPY